MLFIRYSNQLYSRRRKCGWATDKKSKARLCPCQLASTMVLTITNLGLLCRPGVLALPSPLTTSSQNRSFCPTLFWWSSAEIKERSAHKNDCGHSFSTTSPVEKSFFPLFHFFERNIAIQFHVSSERFVSESLNLVCGVFMCCRVGEWETWGNGFVFWRSFYSLFRKGPWVFTLFIGVVFEPNGCLPQS